MPKYWLIWGIVLGVSSAALADEALEFSIHRQYESIRALGMGNAFTAVADDYSGLFLNPAALARREDTEFNASLDLALSSSYKTFADDVQKASNTKGTDAEKEAAILDVVKKTYGSYFHLRTAPASAVLVAPNWGFAVIPMDLTYNMSAHDLLSLHATAYADTTIAFGMAKDFNHLLDNGRFSLGFTAKAIYRGYFSEALSAVDVAENPGSVDSKRVAEGYGADADIGALWTPSIPEDGLFSVLRLAKPSFSLVVRNVAESTFTKDMNVYTKEESSNPEKLYRVLDIGSRWEYPALWIFGGRGTLDFRDIGHPNYNARKGLHAGLEFDWRVASWWKGQYRVGINQGFLTLGASALFTIFSLDLVTYGEDVGTFSRPQESRRYALRMNLNF